MGEVCAAHAQIQSDVSEIKKDTKAILDRLNTGDVTFATVGIRIGLLEKLVYGAVGVSLTGLLVAVIGLVVKIVK